MFSLRRRIGALFVMLSLFSLLVFSPSAFALSWNTHVIEAQPNPCWTTLAVGEWGTAVLYADGVSTGLRLAWGGPDAWEYESLAPAGASGSWVRCCTLESGDLLAAWYHTPLGHSLMTAVGRPGEEWNVASREFLGVLPDKREMGLSLKVGPFGYPWVACVMCSSTTKKGALKLVFPTVSSPDVSMDLGTDPSMRAVGASCDIVIGDDGTGHLAYFRESPVVIRYRMWSPGQAVQRKDDATMGSEATEGVSLLLSDGGAVTAFFRNNLGNLCCKVFSNDLWSASIVLDAGAKTGGFATSLRDSHGKTFVFYSGGGEGGVRLLTDRTGEWKIHVVDPVSILGSRCAATLSGDAVLVSYWDAFSKAVKLLRVENTPPSIPSGPGPADGSELVAAPGLLSWNPCSDDENDGVTYSVYASDKRWKVDALEEDALVLSGEATLSADVPEALRASSPVYWRVVATDSYGSSREGATWSYEVLPSPTPTSEPSSTPTPIPSPTTSPTSAATNTPTPAVLPTATPTDVPSPTPGPGVTPTSVPTPTHAPTKGPGPTSNPEPSPSRSPTPTSFVPSPVTGNAESKAGCDATGGSLIVLTLLTPLLLGPLDRK